MAHEGTMPKQTRLPTKPHDSPDVPAEESLREQAERLYQRLTRVEAGVASLQERLSGGGPRGLEGDTKPPDPGLPSLSELLSGCSLVAVTLEDTMEALNNRVG